MLSLNALLDSVGIGDFVKEPRHVSSFFSLHYLPFCLVETESLI